MSDQRAKIRLFVDAPLATGQDIILTAQAHYLANVMRVDTGTNIALFNGKDGEWRARLTHAGKRMCTAICEIQTAPQALPPDLWLLFAPIKKTRTDFIVEKATEMGARAIQPVFTDYTNAERVRPEKLYAHCIEAAEQCGGTYVPELMTPTKLSTVLANWPQDRKILFCDERMSAPSGLAAIKDSGAGPWAILIGPEGGFSDAEVARIRALPQTVSITLGPRILRADTAAVAALSLWQITLGDWT